MKALDLAGVRFGRLTTIRANGKSSKGEILWLCVCDCGKEISRRGTVLAGGRTQSCGCLAIDLATKHSGTRRGQRTAEYRAWAKLKERCLNPAVRQFKNYGGRGITVCDRWLESFENFLADMGPKPSAGHSIDRFPDNDGPYEPGNCRWATRLEQNRNKRGQPTLVETSLMRHMHRRGARFADLAHAFGYDARTTKRYATGANQ